MNAQNKPYQLDKETLNNLKQHELDQLLIEACNRKDIALLNYCLFDYKINKTEDIEQFLAKKE